VSALELPAEEVAEPALQERRHPAHKEEPDAPAGRPEPAARPLPHRPRVEPVVDHVLQVFAHADLLHQLVLVPVHAWNTVAVGLINQILDVSLKIRSTLRYRYLDSTE
jgi:hypothetical protein